MILESSKAQAIHEILNCESICDSNKYRIDNKWKNISEECFSLIVASCIESTENTLTALKTYFY